MTNTNTLTGQQFLQTTSGIIRIYKPIFVINDKYVKLRIAAIEGKTIEILDVDGKWKHLEIRSNSAFIYPVEDYRIREKGSK